MKAKRMRSNDKAKRIPVVFLNEVVCFTQPIARGFLAKTMDKLRLNHDLSSADQPNWRLAPAACEWGTC